MPAARLILEPVPTPGVWNMAVDETLLESALASGTVTIRIYQWSAPTISLGYFQDADELERDPQWVGLAAVRRLSGGGAILHDREITYSISLPPSHAIATHPSRLYAIAHDALIAVLAAHGVRAVMRGGAAHQPEAPARESGCADVIEPSLALRTSESNVAQSSIDHRRSTINPFLCFGRGDPHDIVLGPHKIVGSAQRRRRGAILQHGSILLELSPHAPDFPGIGELTGVRLDPIALSRQVGTAITQAFGAQSEPAELTAAEHDAAQALERTRYNSLRWRGSLPLKTNSGVPGLTNDNR